MDERALNTQETLPNMEVHKCGPECDSNLKSSTIGTSVNVPEGVQTIQVAPAAGNPQPGQPTLSKKEYKALLNKYFTVRHKVVRACGHKLDTNRDPKHRNCNECWTAYFLSNKGMLDIAAECLSQLNGAELLTKIRGTTYAKKFAQFVVQLAKMQKQAEAAKESKDGDEGEITRAGDTATEPGRIDGGAATGTGPNDGAAGTAGIGQPDTGGTAGAGPTEHEGSLGGTEEGRAGA